MIDKDAVKKVIQENHGNGWLILVDIIYDNVPSGIEITEVFQKYGALEIRYIGKNEHFEELVDNVRYISQKMCEICGQSGAYSIIGGWETTLCDQHYIDSDAKKKFRSDG